MAKFFNSLLGLLDEREQALAGFRVLGAQSYLAALARRL